MADIINLRLHRKRKAREDAAKLAAENRVRHGRTKAEKQRETAENAEAARRLEGLRREPGEDHDKN
jgi:hypothetical protein